jgi:hypothetical protein
MGISEVRILKGLDKEKEDPPTVIRDGWEAGEVRVVTHFFTPE